MHCTALSEILNMDCQKNKNHNNFKARAESDRVLETFKTTSLSESDSSDKSLHNSYIAMHE